MVRTCGCPSCGRLHQVDDGRPADYLAVYHDVFILEPCPACGPGVSLLRERGWAGDRRTRYGERIR